MPSLPFPPPLPAARAFDLVGLGANACDRLLIIPHHPAPGEKVRFQRLLLQGGGQTATALVTAARLGCRVRYLGGFGDDAAGELSLAQLRDEGIDVEGVRVRPGGLSQQAYILVDASTGERTILWGRSEGMIVAPDELEPGLVTAGRMLHTDAQQPLSAACAARWARAAGMPVLADLEPVRPGLEEFLPEVDILIAAEEFPRAATGATGLREALLALRERTRGGLVMATLGARGVALLAGDQLELFGAYAVDAVDTTGAGDVFHGAFAVACLRGLALAEAIDFSQAVAALKCLALGGRTGIPRSLEEVERFRRQTPHRPAGPA